MRPRFALRLRNCRGGGRGPELPILVQPAVLAAAPALPQRETGSEKRKKIARRKLPNIGPLLHHHQPLSKATRAHSPTHFLLPSSSHLLNSPSRRPFSSPGLSEQSNSCHAPKDNSLAVPLSVWCDLLSAGPDFHRCSIPESYFSASTTTAHHARPNTAKASPSIANHPPTSPAHHFQPGKMVRLLPASHRRQDARPLANHDRRQHWRLAEEARRLHCPW